MQNIPRSGAVRRARCIATATVFSRGFERLSDRYRSAVQWVLKRRLALMGAYAVLVGLLALLFVKVAHELLPQEDQGRAQLQYTLPPGATLPRTMAALAKIENYFLTEEREDVPIVYAVVGQSQAGSGQNAGRGFIALAPWDERKGPEAQRRRDHAAGFGQAGCGTARRRVLCAESTASARHGPVEWPSPWSC